MIVRRISRNMIGCDNPVVSIGALSIPVKVEEYTQMHCGLL